ncbi:MAG: DoxX family protein [Proteobacteria bacterium]|nr:DoxX family protein [Pseudomonadota bacterium]
MSDGFYARWAPYQLSILRIMSSLLFVAHGTQKLFNFPMRPTADGAAPPAFELMSLIGAAGILEFVGGALLLIGLFTRPVAFVLSGMMAVAYFIAHHPRTFYPVNNGGDAAILFCFIFLLLFFTGGGPLSVDAIFARRRAEAAVG